MWVKRVNLSSTLDAQVSSLTIKALQMAYLRFVLFSKNKVIWFEFKGLNLSGLV